jgi:glycosyltransferase involved in cell wall biosynthesis
VTLAATVIVPTYRHGPTLYHSVRTALAQTVVDIEVLIVGDGVDAVTRDVAADLQRRDRRVRFMEFPKGPRNGEIHRHAALTEARGRIVCYLSDDDLWFPNHIATMDELLRDGVEFAHSLPLRIDPSGRLGDWSGDIGLPYFRRVIMAGRNWIPLSCGAHTLDAYRRLPVGWSTTPRHVEATDAYMWQKLLVSTHGALSGTRPTVIVFPSPERRGWPMERRAEELAEWRGRIADPGWRAGFVETTLAHVVRERARLVSLSPRSRGLSALARLRLLRDLDRARKAAKAVFAQEGRSAAELRDPDQK